MAAAVVSPSAMRRGLCAPGSHLGQQQQQQQQPQQYLYQPASVQGHHLGPAVHFPQQLQQPQSQPQHHYQLQPQHQRHQQQPVYQQAFATDAHAPGAAHLGPSAHHGQPGTHAAQPQQETFCHQVPGPEGVPAGVLAASSQSRKRNRLTAAATFSGSLTMATAAAAVSAVGPTSSHSIRKSSTMPNWPPLGLDAPEPTPYQQPTGPYGPEGAARAHPVAQSHPQMQYQVRGAASSVFEPINQEGPVPCQTFGKPAVGAPIGCPQPQSQQPQPQQQQYHQVQYQQQHPPKQQQQQQQQAEHGSSYDPVAFASGMRGLQGTPLERLLNATPDIVVDVPPPNPPKKPAHARAHGPLPTPSPDAQGPLYLGYTSGTPGSSPPPLQSISGASNPGQQYQMQEYPQQLQYQQTTQPQYQQPQYQQPQYQQYQQPQQQQQQPCYEGQMQGWGGAPVVHQGLPTCPELEGPLVWAGTEPLQAQESRTGGSHKAAKTQPVSTTAPVTASTTAPVAAQNNVMPKAYQGAHQPCLTKACMGPPALPPASSQPRPGHSRLSPDSSCTYQGTPPAPQQPYAPPGESEVAALPVYQGQGHRGAVGAPLGAAGGPVYQGPKPTAYIPRASAFQPVKGSAATWLPASSAAPLPVSAGSRVFHMAAGGSSPPVEGTGKFLLLGSSQGVPSPQSQSPPVSIGSGTPQVHPWGAGTPGLVAYNNNCNTYTTNTYPTNINTSNNGMTYSNMNNAPAANKMHNGVYGDAGLVDSDKGAAREFSFFPCPGTLPVYQGCPAPPPKAAPLLETLPQLLPSGPEAAAKAASAVPGMGMGIGPSTLPHSHLNQSPPPLGGTPAAHPAHTRTHTNTSTDNTTTKTCTDTLSPPGVPAASRARRMTFGEGVGTSWIPEADPSPARRPRHAKRAPGAPPCRGAQRGLGAQGPQGAQGEEEIGEDVDLGLGLSLMGRSLSVSSTSSTTNPSK